MDETELRRQRRMAMRGVPERLGLAFAGGGIEMRAMPNGTAAGSNFEWRGYATVYDADFPMWDPHGEPYTESVAQGACRRTLANPALDVPFLVGHNDAGIPMARTKSGTMKLSEDSHGLLVHVPAMDGRREDVRALASAVERGDMSEMSLAFVCNRQEWDADFEHRTIVEMDLHRGDVCAVVHGANPATAGAWMTAVEQLAFRRPAAIGAPAPAERRASLAEQHGHPGKPCIDPDGDGDCDQSPGGDTDHDYWSADGRQLKPLPDQRAASGPYELRGGHGPYTGTHSHAHPAMGSQGGDDTHEHEHSHDGDADHSHAHEERAAAVLRELLSVSAAGRDKAKAAGNALPDGSYPINNVAQLHAAAILAASHHGDWKAAQALIRRRAKELGVDVATLPGFGEEKAGGPPLEVRAAATDNMNLGAASDYDAAAALHPYDGTHDHGGADCAYQCVPHVHVHSAARSANVMVDDSTGIPGEETQFTAARRLELRLRELELEELAAR